MKLKDFICEDAVAVRFMKDLISKAIASGNLTNTEKQWANQMLKRVDKSGKDGFVYPKLDFDHGEFEYKPQKFNKEEPPQQQQPQASKKGSDTQKSKPTPKPFEIPDGPKDNRGFLSKLFGQTKLRKTQQVPAVKDAPPEDLDLDLGPAGIKPADEPIKTGKKKKIGLPKLKMPQRIAKDQTPSWDKLSHQNFIPANGATDEDDFELGASGAGNKRR